MSGKVMTDTSVLMLIKPTVISVDPASTGTLTVQVSAGASWATLGVIPSGEAKLLDVSSVEIRCLVSGSVTYEVQ